MSTSAQDQLKLEIEEYLSWCALTVGPWPPVVEDHVAVRSATKTSMGRTEWLHAAKFIKPGTSFLDSELRCAMLEVGVKDPWLGTLYAIDNLNGLMPALLHLNEKRLPWHF